MRLSRRLASLPPYPFADLGRRVAERRAAGVDVISLAMGDPDLPPPEQALHAARRALDDPATHRYPAYAGLPELREAVAGWYRRRFGVTVDPDTQVLPLIGVKEALAHLPLAVLDPGDEVLVPDPGYPVYVSGTLLAGGKPVPLRLDPARGFLPDLDAAPVSDATRLLLLNYPSNPTGGVADADLFRRALGLGREHGLLVVHDAPYSEVTFDGFEAPSVLENAAADDLVLELGSASKTYSLAGWRVGWAVGSEAAVGALRTMKTNVDTGIWNAAQLGVAAALTDGDGYVRWMRDVYERRRNVVVAALRALGAEVTPPLGSTYVWTPTPGGVPSAAFAERALEEAGVVVTPGPAYGSAGAGYVRISLTVPDERLEEAMDRLRRAFA